MNSSENIRNAIQVLYKTYENVQKLMDYTRIVAQEKTDYRLAAPKALRWKSDNETNGWLINDFILLFQNSTDLDCESKNGWKEAPVYAMEIFLGSEDDEGLPCIYLSKFEYNDINSWNEGCSPANHWAFFWPLRDENNMDFACQGDYWIGKPINEKYSSKHWGLKRITYENFDLMALNSENLKQMVFDRFDLLREMD
jgi:hypothetical protein